MLKVLLLSDDLPPRSGGLGNHVKTLAMSLSNRGHEVRLITTSPSPHKIRGLKIIQAKSAISYIPKLCNVKFVSPLPDPLLLGRITHEIGEFRPDIIHAHGWIAFSLAQIRRKFKNTAFIATLHGFDFYCPNLSLFHTQEKTVCTKKTSLSTCLSCLRTAIGPLRGLGVLCAFNAFRRTLDNYDCFIAVNSMVASLARRELNARVVLIPNFIDLRQFAGTDVKESQPPEVVYVGGLIQEKGIFVLLQAHEQLSHLNVNCNLTLFGLRRPNFEFPNTGRRNVRLFINVSRKKLLEEMSKAAIIVIPSICADACPTVALEAMALKKPIVASNVGGLPELISNRQTGLLVQPGNVGELAMAIEYLVENPEVRLEMGKRGFERLKRSFIVDNVVQKIERVYEDCFQTL